MAVRVHWHLKVIAFNANGTRRKCYEPRKQLQDLHLDVDVFSETSRTL
jgi:hypothetical protein